MKNKKVLIPPINRQGGERLMTCHEPRPDATNGLKLMMVSIIFILQRPERLLLFMCTATKKKNNKNLEKFVGSITPTFTIKEVNFLLFSTIFHPFFYEENEKWPITLVKCFKLYDRYCSSVHYRFCFDRTKN